MPRPLFHFTARSGWINDPHGITFRDGGYDAFYQYVPGQTVWRPNCHWGHARGPDLLSLVERTPAIAPGDGDEGIWTGCLVSSPKGPRIFYTSVAGTDLAIGRVRVASPRGDEWDSWQKGPVVITAPSGVDLVGFRDPFIRRDPDAWRAFLGAGDTDGVALALAYRSDDLVAWEYEGVALERPGSVRDPAWLGAMWECPQIFEIDGRFVMLSSAWEGDVLHHAGYAVGSYAAGRFDAETWGQLTYGPTYYAPSFFLDEAERPSVTLWMRGVADLGAGWAGAHSIPYLLSLDGDALVATPHPDLLRYRGVQSTSGRVSTSAADIEWTGAGSLVIEDDAGSVLLRATASAGVTEVLAEGDRWAVPHRDPAARVVVDHGVVEFGTDRGLLGFTASPSGPGLRVTGPGVALHPLERDLIGKG